MTSKKISISNYKPQGDYMADCKAGHALAREVVERLRAGEEPIVLASLARDLFAAGSFGGFEAGFFTQLGAYLARP